MKTETDKHYDLIGDIHGHYDKLAALLERLGYHPHENHYRHPEGRKVIFLGDYIDRGPRVRDVLRLVRAMVATGEALAIMGNHELNTIFYHTPDGNGGYLRKHEGRNLREGTATRAAFVGHEHEWAGWLEWMKRLPMFLDLGELRAVHAAWDEKIIAFLKGKTLLDDAFLHAAGTYGTPEFKALERVLKGPELTLPEGVFFRDKEGIERENIRVRWWNIAGGMTVGDIAMPEPIDLPEPLPDDDLAWLPNYPADAPPVFFGHYWMPPDAPKEPLAENIVVLDFSAAMKDHPLYAYRWNGGGKPAAEHFITYELAA